MGNTIDLWICLDPSPSFSLDIIPHLGKGNFNGLGCELISAANTNQTDFCSLHKSNTSVEIVVFMELGLEKIRKCLMKQNAPCPYTGSHSARVSNYIWRFPKIWAPQSPKPWFSIYNLAK